MSVFFMFYIYSFSNDKYYVCYSTDPLRRVIEHNTKPFKTYSSKCRPWVLKVYFQCSASEKETIRIEPFIKKQKSRKLLEQLCNPDFIPSGFLAQLVRVPDVRD